MANAIRKIKEAVGLAVPFEVGAQLAQRGVSVIASTEKAYARRMSAPVTVEEILRGSVAHGLDLNEVPSLIAEIRDVLPRWDDSQLIPTWEGSVTLSSTLARLEETDASIDWLRRLSK